MSQKAIPIIDFDALITAINALSAPSATDVAVSTANMHYITEDDAQGALAELDAEAYAINSSLAQSAWTETSSGSGCYYCKFNGIVFVKVHNISVTGRSSLSLGTLPDGFRPTQQINTAIVGGSYREYTGQLQISSAGAISVYCNTTANYWGFVVIPPI